MVKTGIFLVIFLKNGARPFVPTNVPPSPAVLEFGKSLGTRQASTMSAKTQVTITLGHSGRVVKRARTSSQDVHSDSRQSVGGKWPATERLGNNSDGFCDLSQSKHLRSESSDYYKSGSANDDQWIDRNDLRLKLMQKKIPRQTNINSDIHHLNLHGKPRQNAQVPVTFYSCRDEIEPKTSQFLEKSPLRITDDLLHVSSLRKSCFPGHLDGFPHISPDRLLGSYRGLSSPRNYCNDMKRVPVIRSDDLRRSTPVLAKCVIDAPPTATFVSRAHTSFEHSKPVMKLPPSNGALKTSYMVEEPTGVGNLLHSLGLGKYAIHFEAEEVDMAALQQMGDSDLKELGIPMGPRKKILLAASTHLRRRHA